MWTFFQLIMLGYTYKYVNIIYNNNIYVYILRSVQFYAILSFPNLDCVHSWPPRCQVARLSTGSVKGFPLLLAPPLLGLGQTLGQLPKAGLSQAEEVPE